MRSISFVSFSISNRRLALQPYLSDPWQEKHLSNRIALTSRIKSNKLLRSVENYRKDGSQFYNLFCISMQILELVNPKYVCCLGNFFILLGRGDCFVGSSLSYSADFFFQRSFTLRVLKTSSHGGTGKGSGSCSTSSLLTQIRLFPGFSNFVRMPALMY